MIDWVWQAIDIENKLNIAVEVNRVVDNGHRKYLELKLCIVIIFGKAVKLKKIN